MKISALTMVTASPGFVPWTVATVGARLPVAMAPLALILAGHGTTGSYGFGGVLVAAHTVGEILGSPVTGRIADTWTARSCLTLFLGGQCALFVLAGWSLGTDQAKPAAIGLTGAAGLIAAGVPGALRSRLTQFVPEPAVAMSLSVDSALNQLSWAVAPVLIGLLTAVVDPAALLYCVAAPAAVSALACLGLPPIRRRWHEEGVPFVSLVRRLSATLTLTVTLRLALGILSVAAAPLFARAGGAEYAGLALGLYALGTGISSLILGSRMARVGDPEKCAGLGVLALGCALSAGAVLGTGLASLLAFYAVAGFLEGPIVVALSVHIQQVMPAGRRATAFSVQYAAIGVGFALGSASLGPLLRIGTPGAAVAIVGTAMMAAVATIIIVRHVFRRRARGQLMDHSLSS